MVVLGCTEPNPHLMDTGESGSSSAGSTGPSTSSDPTSATTSPTTTTASSTTEDPDTTMGTTVEPTETGTTLTTTDDGTSTGEPTCASTCVALPPGDWQGPAAVLHDAPDDPAPDCTGDFTEPSDAVFANLDAPAAMCTCECDAPTGLDCSPVTLSQFSDAACTVQTAGQTTDWVLTTSCNSLSMLQAANGTRYRASAVIDAGSCEPNPTSIIPDAVFGDRYTACGLGRLDVVGCDAGDACVSTPTAPYDGRICIWHDGDQQCPTDIGYDVRSIYYGNAADDRDCETCTCGDPEGDCSGGVQIFGTDTCNEAPTGGLTISGSCAVMNNITAARVNVGNPDTPDPEAECAPSDVQATGQAEGIDPVTFCCDS